MWNYNGLRSGSGDSIEIDITQIHPIYNLTHHIANLILDESLNLPRASLLPITYFSSIPLMKSKASEDGLVANDGIDQSRRYSEVVHDAFR